MDYTCLHNIGYDINLKLEIWNGWKSSDGTLCWIESDGEMDLIYSLMSSINMHLGNWL